MNQLMVKEVNYADFTMIACQNENGKIHVGIRSMCDGLGVDYSSQLKRIERDDVLPEGVVKMTIPTKSGEQEANMLDITYLPFFLVGIKSGMVRPEIAPKIVEFKLKAKDVLAAAFLPDQAQIHTPIDPAVLTAVTGLIKTLGRLMERRGDSPQQIIEMADLGWI